MKIVIIGQSVTGSQLKEVSRMILIEETYKERQCNCCHKENEVLEVIFRSDYNRQGTAIALCRDCRDMLRQMLEDEAVNKIVRIDS